MVLEINASSKGVERFSKPLRKSFYPYFYLKESDISVLKPLLIQLREQTAG